MAAEQNSAAFVPQFSVSQQKWDTFGPARSLTAVGVEGALGASYTVYAANWKCSECMAENYPNRTRCHRCRAPKPADAEEKIVNGRHNPWREVFDSESKRIYYFNTETNATQWERPVEMGAAPHATGWFGRGAAGNDASAKYEAMNDEFLKRPARKQADSVSAKNTVLEGAYEYNIWYGKFMGEHWDNKKGRDPAESRCYMDKDAGYTKADKHMNNAKYFCLFFARGQCAYGHTCQFAHRVPSKKDVERAMLDEIHDIFGRERHKDHRDDMDGVGSLTKPCRTLYVGNLQKAKYKDPQHLEAALWRRFGEWGEVENINLIARLSIAFVRYRYRCHAEFGKEAMCNQPLEQDEVLNIRWAFDDPNPVAQEAARRADADAVVNMLKAKGVAIGVEGNTAQPTTGAIEGDPAAMAAAVPALGMGVAQPGNGAGAGWGDGAEQLPYLETGTVAAEKEVSRTRPDDYHQPAPKRIRLDGSDAGTEVTDPREAAALDQQYGQAGVVWYPNTDGQFSASSAAATTTTTATDARSNATSGVNQAWDPASLIAPQPQPPVPLAPALPPPPAASLAGGASTDWAWRPVMDPTTQRTYFYNQETKVTAWTLPPAAAAASAAAHAAFQAGADAARATQTAGQP